MHNISRFLFAEDIAIYLILLYYPPTPAGVFDSPPGVCPPHDGRRLYCYINDYCIYCFIIWKPLFVH